MGRSMACVSMDERNVNSWLVPPKGADAVAFGSTPRSAVSLLLETKVLQRPIPASAETTRVDLVCPNIFSSAGCDEEVIE